MKRVLFFFLLVISSAQLLASDVLRVAVVNYPLQYFAERIAGDAADVLFLAPMDEDPAFWQPSAEAISHYQQADLILLNGASYAKWVKKVSLPRARLVDTGKAYRDQLIEVQGPSHNHGPEGDHSHAGTAFTTWLDFQQAQRQVDAIVKAFSRKQPDQAEVFARNAEALKADLSVLDQSMLELGAQLEGNAFVASHPVYQYLSRRYQLQVTALMWEPEMELGAKAISDLYSALSDQSAKWMIWEGEPSETNRNKLAELGLESVVFSPAGNRPEQGDWLQLMQGNVEALRRVLAP
jgi:zinc transport system substrate-binding protein